jgi:hypothetical protein
MGMNSCFDHDPIHNRLNTSDDQTPQVAYPAKWKELVTTRDASILMSLIEKI